MALSNSSAQWMGAACNTKSISCDSSPASALGEAIAIASKLLNECEEKFDSLASGFSFVLRPEQPSLAKGVNEPRACASESVEQLRGLAARIGQLSERIDYVRNRSDA